MPEPVIAVGFSTSEADRRALARQLGQPWRIEDIRRAPADCALVLVRPCSPQALRSLHRSYPRADIVVLDQAEHPDRQSVLRALEAGASEYAAGSGLGQVGGRLRDRARTGPPEPVGEIPDGPPQRAAEVA